MIGNHRAGRHRLKSVIDLGVGIDPSGFLPELPRKEVIQPQLPLQLPCYDFVPITSPTFDSSFPYGLGHRLRVLPTFVT